jgi:aspartyl-tRNA(Asn)/glutamyl-tRNA(Gln) amidotransferase subunit A
MAIAARVDERVRAGESLLLAGVPMVVKDNICIGSDIGAECGAGVDAGRTTCASRILEQYRSPFTATCVRRAIRAGAVPIAKANLDEFAMGSSTEHSAFGPTKNPWDTSRVPGGSSGGSAAMVACGAVPLALGSDTGGSVRQPAALCGAVGMKPTYGRVSRYGLVAYASSLDQVGPIAANVRDVAALLRAIAGRDALDATSSPRAALQDVMENTSLRGVRVGVPAESRNAANHESVSRALEATIALLRALGATVVDVELPSTKLAIAAYYIVATAEASSNLARFDGVRYGTRAVLRDGEGLFELYARTRGECFGKEVQRRILLGTHVLSAGYSDAYYVTALRARRRLLRESMHILGRDGAACDAMLMPTAPSPAWRIGEKSSDPLAMYLEDVYTVGVNLAGLPAISIPAALAEVDGVKLPVGMQLIGAPFEDERLLSIAQALEAAIGPMRGTPAVHAQGAQA